MISDKYKFVYVHIPKTAGISIRTVLEPFANDDEDAWNTDHHYTAAYYRKMLDNNKDYTYFTVVRNTYARLCSFGFYKYQKFDEDILRNMIEKAKQGNKIFRQATYFFKHEDGLVIKAESIQEDFNKVCDVIGIPRQELPILNTTDHEHYSKYYTKEMIEMVKEFYPLELDVYKYEFENE